MELSVETSEGLRLRSRVKLVKDYKNYRPIIQKLKQKETKNLEIIQKNRQVTLVTKQIKVQRSFKTIEIELSIIKSLCSVSKQKLLEIKKKKSKREGSAVSLNPEIRKMENYVNEALMNKCNRLNDLLDKISLIRKEIEI